MARWHNCRLDDIWGGPSVEADEQREIRRFLSAGDWFGGLPDALQQLIVSRSRVRKFAKGQVISVEDSVPKALYAVLEGHVHIVRETGTGDEGLVHVGEPGFWCGELGVLSRKPTLVTILAHSRVRALVLPKAQFDRIVAGDPRHYQEFAKLVFDRYAALLRVFAEIRELAPESRLRGRLVAMARLRNQDRRDAAPEPLSVSQADLARMVGVSRQTLNAILGKLHQEGLIEVGFRRIRVLDEARLADRRGGKDPAERGGADVRRRASSEPPRAHGGPIA